jgi:hypothetical protein
MNNITIILPINEFGESTKSYLDGAIKSVLNQADVSVPCLIVYSHLSEEGGLLDFLTEKGYGERIKTIKNEGKTDFASQINFGAKSIDTEYFSVLEFDDEFTPTYFRNVAKYTKKYPDITMFLPITLDVDDKSNTPIQLVNQNIWSNGYIGENGELGFLNIRSIAEFSYYTIGGAAIKRLDFLSLGGLKSNIVLAFTYEFLLRLLNNGNKIFTIPKYGYKHVVNRDGSLFMGYAATLTQNDKRFWFETAKKESHFFTDRVINMSKKIIVDSELVSG